jgi:integrase
VKSHKTGGVPIVMTMHKELSWLLNEVVKSARPDQEYLVERLPGRPFRDFHTTWNRACKTAKIPGFRFESLRNTYTSWRVEEGVSLGLIQQALAHTTIATTAKYYNKAKAASEVIVKTQRSIFEGACDQLCDQLVTKAG